MEKIYIISGIILSLLIVIILASGFYFFKFAEIRNDNTENEAASTATGRTKNFEKNNDFIKQNSIDWKIKSSDDFQLVGKYLPAQQKTNKTVILIHGYKSDHTSMSDYAAMFNKMGYNILMPDNRASGKSEGKYIGYGYLDAKDYLLWIDEVLSKNGQESEILVMGESMGAATTMMLSGMNPPQQVKCYIEDAGYSSVAEEIKYQAKSMFHLPDWISSFMIPVVSTYSKVFAGYDYYQASATELLKKNDRPMLFIHGESDDFVPTKFIDEVYPATKGRKEKYTVPGAKHVQSYAKNPKKYEEIVKSFTEKYFK
ncbi:alpha/beta hydrolase [Lactococcus garvieae]|uniref:alpha/beta hydrolase n=1 Tax=Lactococcus garvieae TaxID=1363 RepID=UPI00254EEED0|nr:alpha/beta hydrolase [Lactococcus garvieae]